MDGSPGTPVACLLWVIVWAGWWGLFSVESVLLIGGMDAPAVERTLANCLLAVVLGFALIIWTLLRALGRVSGESAAGLFLAGAALLLRNMSEIVVGYVNLHPPSLTWADSTAGGWIATFRHTGTFAYGVGLAFAVGACWADLRRPRVA
jgi:hypothetical protein